MIIENSIPSKKQWHVNSSSTHCHLAIDTLYSTEWVFSPTSDNWLEIDLGVPALLGGLELYWGTGPIVSSYHFEYSLDKNTWFFLCGTEHGEGGQDVFAFPPTMAQFIRWKGNSFLESEFPLRVAQINLSSPEEAASVHEANRISVLGRCPVHLVPGDCITVDFKYIRAPLGVLVRWGKDYGTTFSVHLSEDGEHFREVGRIEGSRGEYDSFYWRSTKARFLRFILHEASTPEGAIVEELKLRLLNKDRMPIGQLEQAAENEQSDLVPQSLLGRQVYWTTLGESEGSDIALFDEYGNIEPRAGSGQLTPLLKVQGAWYGLPGSTRLVHTLAEGIYPIPTVAAQIADNIECRITGCAYDRAAWIEYHITYTGTVEACITLALTVRPVQINPYWQHGGHAPIHALNIEDRTVFVNNEWYAVFSKTPDRALVRDFDEGDVIHYVKQHPFPYEPITSSSSSSCLLSGVAEFDCVLSPGAVTTVVVAFPLQQQCIPEMFDEFSSIREKVVHTWQEKMGPRRITVGDPEINDTVAAQTGLILVNATRYAFKPGPRHYSRTWIRDGASQALALLYAGLIEEAKSYVIWYSERIYDDGMVPPILNEDGSVYRGYGSDIEFDAQGEFIHIAAETYRFSRDPHFLEAIFEPVVRAARFIEALCTKNSVLHRSDTRFYGLLLPSISHEGYNKPTYSYWDNFFALRGWRDCAYLAKERGDTRLLTYAQEQEQSFRDYLTRSIRLSAEKMHSDQIPASADRLDTDPTSIAIAFEPCRVEEVLPHERIEPTYRAYCTHLNALRQPHFQGGFTPYEIRNLNVLVALGWYTEAYQLVEDALTWRRPTGWRHWAEVVWGEARAPDYLGDMPHTWIGAEFATAIRRMLVRENGDTLELFRAVPTTWWKEKSITIRTLPTHFGMLDLTAHRSESQLTVELHLTGNILPTWITFYYPGAKQVFADGVPIQADADVIRAPHWNHLLICYGIE